jgi:hypothetical protein
MVFPVKQVRTLEERLHIIEEVKKNPSEDWCSQAIKPATINPKYDYCEEKIREHAYVSVDQELATCGVLCVEEMCGELGSGSCVEEVRGGSGDDDNEAESEPVPSFTEALCAFESMRASMYAHIITERD